MNKTRFLKCLVDGKKYRVIDGMFLKELEPAVKNQIKSDYHHAKSTSFICRNHLLRYRLDEVNRMLASDTKRNRKINRKLTRALNSDNYAITDVNQALQKRETFGQRVSDGVAHFGGSWGFIFVFVGFLLIWMIVNGLALFGIHFDPYPYILLNLALSCISAIQAPIIMMSQNRSADHDRLSAENDYHVNLKSEHELRILHAKLDHLNQDQLPHNLEVQKLQLQILGEVRAELTDLRTENRNLRRQLSKNSKRK